MKKALSFILTLILIISCVPAAVFAAGPKSITKIEVNSAPSHVEGTGGRLVSTFNAETGEYTGSYFEYDLDPISVHLWFADGSDRVVQTQADCYDATGYYWDLTSDQSADTPWDIGYHTATVTIGPKSANYLITIFPSSIKAIRVPDVTLVEGVDGYDSYAYNQYTGEFESYFKYFYLPSAIVTRADGSEGEVTYSYYDGDTYGELQFADDQSPSNTWGVGPHIVRAYLLGRYCTFTVNVIPNPFDSVEFHDTTVMKRINSTTVPGFRYYMYNCNFTVTTTDGKKLESTDGYLYYEGKYYYPSVMDDQYTNHWTGENELGDHYVNCEFAGLAGTMKVTVVDKYYSRMSIREDENVDLFLQFWKSSVAYDEYKVENFVYSGEDEYGWICAQIDVGGNPAMAKFHISHDPSGIPYYEHDFEIDVGEEYGYDSGERRFDILWLKRQMMLPAYAGYTFVQPYYNPEFNGFSRTSYDIDTIVMLACNIRGCFDKYEETGWDEEGAYVFLETRVVLEAAQYVFGLDISEEIKNYKYWPADPDWQFQVRVNKSGVTDYIKDLGFVGKLDNANWRWMTTVYERPDGTGEKIRFRLRPDLTIDAIFFLGPVAPNIAGDVDGDGVVTMKDVLLLRKILAGAATAEEGKESFADVDGDGNITMKDVLLLRKILAGAA